MFASRTLFNSVLKLSQFAGFHSIGNIKISKKLRTLTNFYLSILFVMFFSQIIALLITLIFKYSRDDGSGVLCVVVIMVNNVILIIFYTARDTRIADNYEKVVNFVETILEDPVSSGFVEEVNKYASYVNRFIMQYLISVYVLLLLEFLIKGLTYMKIIHLVTEESALIYVLPWEINNYTFWPTLIFQTVSTALMTVIQQANHYYLMTMMIMQTLCFRHLRASLAHIIDSDGKDVERCNISQMKLLTPLYKQDYFDNRTWQLEPKVESGVKNWIQIHIQLLSLCKEFVDIYSPLLVSYFLVMFVILISGVFSITQNHHYYGLVEEILLGLYFAGIIFNLFMLSIAGSNLSFESVRTFEAAFHAPWYKTSPEVQSCLKVICEVAKRPMRLAAFHSNKFNMSLHTFIWVMRTMVSFYIGLVQIKERSSQHVN